MVPRIRMIVLVSSFILVILVLFNQFGMIDHAEFNAGSVSQSTWLGMGAGNLTLNESEISKIIQSRHDSGLNLMNEIGNQTFSQSFPGNFDVQKFYGMNGSISLGEGQATDRKFDDYSTLSIMVIGILMISAPGIAWQEHKKSISYKFYRLNSQERRSARAVTVY